MNLLLTQSIKIAVLVVLIHPMMALANPSAAYMKFTADNLAKLEADKTSIQKGSTEHCPSLKNPDPNSCYYNYLRNLTIRDITQATTLALVGVTFGLQKRESKGLEAGQIALVENSIMLLNRVDLKYFYLAALPRSPEVDLLRKEEEVLIADFKKRVIVQVENLIQKIDLNLSTRPKIEEFKKDLEVIKNTPWKY